MVNLGDRVKDPITGYQGIVVAMTDWLYGCRRPLVQAEGLTDDGKPKSSESFDEDQLVVLERNVVKRPVPQVVLPSHLLGAVGYGPSNNSPEPEPEPVPAVRNGGPGASPSPHTSPTRR